MSTSKDAQPTGWTGWVVFAAVLMVVAGGIWAIQGLIAVFNDNLVIFGTEGAILSPVGAGSTSSSARCLSWQASSCCAATCSDASSP